MGLRKKLFALFFLSGFCGLLYQVIWVRLAFSHFGVITPVLSVIVSVFMLGLSVGSWAAGQWISPITSRFKISAAYLYALCRIFDRHRRLRRALAFCARRRHASAERRNEFAVLS